MNVKLLKYYNMSQNKTRIQGLDVDETPRFQQASEQPASGGFYSRNAQRPETVIQGMNDDVFGAPQTAPVHKPKQIAGRPVVGFLYSIARSMIGEFWPIYIGRNSIGNNPDCDIVLGEGTVSGNHATLQVRRDKKNNHISAWIMDSTSTNGTMVNDITLGSSPVDCKNGDIITFGDNYECYFVLIDASQIGLKVSEEFIPFEQYNPVPGPQPEPTFDPWGTNGSDYVPTDGTIGTDGSSASGNKGGTRPV